MLLGNVQFRELLKNSLYSELYRQFLLNKRRCQWNWSSEKGLAVLAAGQSDWFVNGRERDKGLRGQYWLLYTDLIWSLSTTPKIMGGGRYILYIYRIWCSVFSHAPVSQRDAWIQGHQGPHGIGCILPFIFTLSFQTKYQYEYSLRCFIRKTHFCMLAKKRPWSAESTESN